MSRTPQNMVDLTLTIQKSVHSKKWDLLLISRSLTSIGTEREGAWSLYEKMQNDRAGNMGNVHIVLHRLHGVLQHNLPSR